MTTKILSLLPLKTMPYKGTIQLQAKGELPKTIAIPDANDLQELCDRIQEQINPQTFQAYEVGEYENIAPTASEYGDITANSGQVALHRRYPIVHQFVAVSKAHLYYGKF